MSRRTTLQWLATAMAASALPSSALTAAPRTLAPLTSKGYGTDPDLLNPMVPWARTMTSLQLQITAVLADLILPETEGAPAPSALGVPDFVDEWVSAPYPQQQADRTVILEGLKGLDAEAARRWQHPFLALEDPQRRALLDATVPRSPADERAEHTFFRRFRYVVVGGYYTTPEGFKAIGYIGNVPLPAYPPVTEQERGILDHELRKLGIQ